MEATDGEGVGRLLADELLAAQAAPGRDVGRGGRIVSQDSQRRPDRQLRQPSGQGDHGQRAPLTAAVQEFRFGHSPATPASVRSAVTMPGSSARNRSTSASVLSRCSDTRTLPCDSTPMATST